MEANSKRFEVKGVNDERDACQCCGKSGLKRVVWIEDHETGEIKHFGTTCALQPVKGFQSDKEIKRAIREWEDREKSLWAMIGRAYRQAGGKYEAHPTKAYEWLPVDKGLMAQCESEARLKRAEGGMRA